jgi:oxygen-dependent protoporphyrinogen oxidase
LKARELFDVAIVGGGITGLSAAWALEQRAFARGAPLSYCLLEENDRWGGKVTTEEVSLPGERRFIIEGGADSFINQKPRALQLARDLGLEERLLPTNDDRRQIFVLHRGRPVPLPDGVMLLVPTRFAPFATSPLLSPWGKMRMGLDWFIPAKSDGQDETLAAFIRRRLGNEALDKIAEPLMAGIYNAEAERQSLLATFPRFRALEERHGSLIKGMLAAKKRTQGGPKRGAGGAPSMFVSFRAGMHELVSALQGRLSGEKRLSSRVISLTPGDAGRYQIGLDDGRSLEARSVILATPAHAAAALLKATAPVASRELRAIRYVSTGTISLAYRRSDVSHPLNGFGVVIPRSEKRRINAITWTSTKFNHRAPAEHILIRVFFGGSRTPYMMELDQEQLIDMVRRELRSIMGIDAAPDFYRVYRWFQANPQYDVGHLERVSAIEAALPPGLFVSGSPYRGVGIPDCVRQAGETAVEIFDYLEKCRKNAELGEIESVPALA